MKKIKDILRRNHSLAILASGAFFIGIPLGLIAYPLMSDKMPLLLNEAFKGVLEGTTLQIILKVFLRNTTASLIILLLGSMILPSLAVLLINGVLVGLVFRFANEKGLNTAHMVLGILPHGVFELPALFIAAALGMRIGLELLTKKGQRIAAARGAFTEASAAYLAVVTPLLVAAAIIEITVSRNLIQ
jgi:stage II sporulation protein M